MNIVKSKVSMEGVRVAVRDEGRDKPRLYGIVDFRPCQNAAEDFAAEGTSFVHLYSFAENVPESVVKFLSAKNELNLTTIRDNATIPKLREVAREEERNAKDFREQADKNPLRKEEFLTCAIHADDRRDYALATIKAIKESAIYTEFGKAKNDE